MRRAASGPSTAIHPSFTCGRPDGLRQPAEAERQRDVRGMQAAAPRRGAERIVGEHFVDDQRRVARRAALDRPASSAAVSIDPVGLFGLTASTARTRVVPAARRAYRNRPSSGRDTRAGTESARTPSSARQMIEQRIARAPAPSRHRRRVAQQLERIGIRFAGARGQHDSFRSNLDAAPLVVARDRRRARPAARAACGS